MVIEADVPDGTVAMVGHQTGCVPVKSNELSGLIESVYNTISKLEKE